MADEPKVTNHTDAKVIAPRKHWLAENSTTVIFLIIVVALVGGYQALNIPIAVFPSTDFPRIVIGIDNGVMPIDQMMVTITRPVEQAVNSVQGLETVRSITSRGSAEIDLVLQLASRYVSDAPTGGCGAVKDCDRAAADREGGKPSAYVRIIPNSWLQPYFRFGAAKPPLGNGDL